ncbi:MAG: molecular chaperone HscC [Spirochaetales bacterium]|nr:molecular chaperone HscC [Spirochaetales bacterium]
MAIIGIDLGTTNSLVSVWDGEGVRLIPNGTGTYLTPSVVHLDRDGSVLVGQAAKDRLITQPENTAAVFKRDMGSQKEFLLGKKSFFPEELSSFVLRSLKEDAESFLGEEVEEAVISVPAYFNDAQRKATRNAGLLAGMKVERLINEPTAAAVAYGLHDSLNDGTFLVLDLGGGTFDVSLLEFTDGIMEVHAVAGDNRLGGEDFTEVLLQIFMDHHGLKKSSLKRKEYEHLYHQAEKCKLALSEQEQALMTFNGKRKSLEKRISREDFSEGAASLLERLRKPIERTIRDGNVELDDIDDLVLVGGATRMPIFRDVVHRLFRRIPSLAINPDEVVGRGTAIQAGLKARDKALDELIMTDICPYTLGTEVVDRTDNSLRTGYFLPIIERNTTIPASRVVQLGTAQDNQSRIKVEIYQGEHRLVKDNIKLGSIEVSLPPSEAGKIPIELRYTYDINGLLEVEVQIKKTGLKKTLIIEENPGVLSRWEIEERLEKLQKIKMHPRDQNENKALLARGERLWEEYRGSTREQIGKALSQFELLLEKQDPEEIKRYRTELTGWLDLLEGSSSS